MRSKSSLFTVFIFLTDYRLKERERGHIVAPVVADSDWVEFPSRFQRQPVARCHVGDGLGAELRDHLSLR